MWVTSNVSSVSGLDKDGLVLNELDVYLFNIV